MSRILSRMISAFSTWENVAKGKGFPYNIFKTNSEFISKVNFEFISKQNSELISTENSGWVVPTWWFYWCGGQQRVIEKVTA